MPNNLLLGLQVLNARAAVAVVGKGPVSQITRGHPLLGVAAGRKVYDSVTGQVVTVVGATVAYVPATLVEEAKHGK